VERWALRFQEEQLLLEDLELAGSDEVSVGRGRGVGVETSVAKKASHYGEKGSSGKGGELPEVRIELLSTGLYEQGRGLGEEGPTG